MINRDELPSAAQIDLNEELCLPPEARSPNHSCCEMAFEQFLVRKEVSRHCTVRSTEVFLPTEQRSLGFGNNYILVVPMALSEHLCWRLINSKCCSNSCQFCTLYCHFYYYCFINFAGPEVGTFIFVSDPGISMSYSSISLHTPYFKA